MVMATEKGRGLQLHPRVDSGGVATPRGRIMDAVEIAAEIFQAKVSPDWVKKYVAPTKRFRMGRSWCWYEADARTWFAKFTEDKGRRPAW